MTNCRKLVSYVLALVMLLGMFYPKTLKAEDGTQETHKTDVVIHKIKLNDLNGWPKPKNGDGTYPGNTQDQKYDGNQIGQIAQYFGDGAVELDGVRFTYWKLTKEQYEKVKAGPANKTVEEVEALLQGTQPQAQKQVTGFTDGGNGVKVEGLEDGLYWFVENDDTKLSDTIIEYAAVPFGLELPVFAPDGKKFGAGDGQALHIYPKNKTSKIDFPPSPGTPGGPGGTGDDGSFPFNENFKKVIVEDSGEIEANKPASASIGETINYKVTTKIPANAKFKQAYWVDHMTEGFTVDNSKIVVKKGVDLLILTNDYTVEQANNGFKISLTDDGLKKVTKQNTEQPITIEYPVLLNNKTEVDVSELNSISFHYGNHKSDKNVGNHPIPVKASNQNINVTLEDCDQEEIKKCELTVKLYDANTNKPVDGQAEHKLTKDNGANTHAFNGLDNNKEYKVVVENIPDGFDVKYTKDSDGNVKVKLIYTGNPKPLLTGGPKVFTYGKKFVKTDNDGATRLAGAQFVIKNEDGNKYLALAKEEGELATLNGLKEALTRLLQEFTALSPEQQQGTDGQQKKTAIDAKQKEYTVQLIKDSDKVKWVASKDEAGVIVLTSNSKGQFEYKGLKQGKYHLEEIQAPAGYAKLTSAIDFSVDTNTYTAKVDKDTHIDYEASSGKKEAQVVKNKKIVIPETGGMGTVLFTIVGSGLMGLALFGMIKRRKRENTY